MDYSYAPTDYIMNCGKSTISYSIGINPDYYIAPLRTKQLMKQICTQTKIFHRKYQVVQLFPKLALCFKGLPIFKKTERKYHTRQTLNLNRKTDRNGQKENKEIK